MIITRRVFILLVFFFLGLQSPDFAFESMEKTEDFFQEVQTDRDIIVHHYTFKGDSQHWYAEFEVYGKEIFEDGGYSGQADEYLLLIYKGASSDLATIKALKYAFTTSSSSGVSSKTFITPPRMRVFLFSRSTKGGDLVRSDEVIQVTVEWDGKVETFALIRD